VGVIADLKQPANEIKEAFRRCVISRALEISSMEEHLMNPVKSEVELVTTSIGVK
jgi:hypothetical protein